MTQIPVMDIIQVLSRYGLQYKHVHPGINIAGSPERTHARVVIEDGHGALWIMEKIPPNAFERKDAIARCLSALSEAGLEQVQPYRKNIQGDYLTAHADGYWQISPFVRAVDLPRPEYVYDQWRGKACADFYIRFKAALDKTRCPAHTDKPFDTQQYIHQFMDQTQKYAPGIHARLQPVCRFLNDRYFAHYKDMPNAFCHGDFHVMNILWGNDHIKKVIDWEFMGMKTEIYDIANMIGCLGIEDPNCLTNETVITFIEALKMRGPFADLSWAYLLEAVIAQRFGWMAEWLRKQDIEMQIMEIDYMRLLLDNYSKITKAWHTLRPCLTKII